MWSALSKAQQDAIDEAFRVAGMPGQHVPAAGRLKRAFPGATENGALDAILHCVDRPAASRDRERYATCLVRYLR